MGSRAVTDPDAAARPHYLLGHSERELHRLDLQGRIYREVTLRAFRDGGLEPGMRVLDMGCGTGDVSLTAAELVGETGAVTGIDRSDEGFGLAHRHAATRGLHHVDFVRSELDTYLAPEPIDAVVGRWVLMHQPDPVAALRFVLRSLRPGGVVVAIETHIDLPLGGDHSEPHSPLYDRMLRWKTEVVRGARAHTRTGPQLPRILEDAGVTDVRARLEAPLEGGPDSLYYRYMEESMLSMLPEAERLGLDGFAPEEIVGIGERLRDEVVAGRGVLMVWPVVVAWGRAPSGG